MAALNQQNAALRKAAILIDTLDPAGADALLEQMGPELASRVRNAVMELGEVDRRERNRVMREFMRVGPLAPPSQTAGIELDDSLAQKLRGPAPPDPAVDPAPTHSRPETPPFRFLHEAAGETLSQLLEQEHPQTIAVVAAHLPPERAADLVTHLPENLQANVLRRIVDLEETDPEILREVEREMELLHWRRLRTVSHRSAGLAAVRAILDAADSGDRKDLLENLWRRDRPLADQLGKSNAPANAPPPTAAPSSGADKQRAEPFRVRPGAHSPAPAPGPPDRNAPAPRKEAADPSPDPPAPPAEPPEASAPLAFGDLASLEDAALAEVLRQSGRDTALVALAGADKALIDRIVRQLPAREARSLRRKLEQAGPLRLSDVEYAQQQIAQLAARLAAQGAIPVPPSTRRFVVAA